MNRRTLLGRLAFGAAAVLGAGMAKEAEASEAPVISGVHTEGNTITVGSGGRLANVQVAPGYGVVADGQNVRIENVTIRPEPFTGTLVPGPYFAESGIYTRSPRESGG